MLKKYIRRIAKVGKALMLPVAILPAAGILLAIGNALQNPALLAHLPVLDNTIVHIVARVMEKAGDIIFSNLSLLFAVGVAVGLAGGDGVAGIAAIIGYLIMNVTMGVIMGVTPEMVGKKLLLCECTRDQHLQTGVFGGVIIGILAAFFCIKDILRFNCRLTLVFFAGKRFVPIITAVMSLILGMLMTVIWPPIQHGLNAFSHSMIESNRTVAAPVFGIVERSLIPFGLHHIFYAPFWFEFGSYVNKAGELVRGDQKIFFARSRMPRL